MSAEYEVVDDNYVFQTHDSDKCPQKCEYVANIDCIFISKEIENQARKAARVNSFWEAILSCFDLLTDPVVRIPGLYSMPRWAGCLQFYAFLCINCEKIGVSYIRGYNLYMICNHCETSFSLRDRKYYKESGLEPPPTFWELFKEIWLRKKDSTSPTSD